MVTLQVLDVSPASNPDKIRFLATLSGDYGVEGTGDPLNLAPFDDGNNPGGFTNPQEIPLPPTPASLPSAPSVSVENLGGSYTQISPLVPGTAVSNGVANGVAADGGFFLRVFNPGGGELATDAAYAGAQIAAGAGIILELNLPHNQ
jgi:hypothetical protein